MVKSIRPGKTHRHETVHFVGEGGCRPREAAQVALAPADAAAVAWTVHPGPHDVAVARGLVRQWTLVAREAMPPILAAISASPTWLAALVRARSLAGTDARALALLDGFDHEIARITGHDAPRWPTRLRKSLVAPLGTLALPMLDPGQQLLCTGALVRETAASRAALSTLLVAAWAEPPVDSIAADLRVRAAALGLPEPFRARWLRGSGLTPPDDVVPGEHRAVLALLRDAYGEAPSDVREVVLDDHPRVRGTAALDVVLATVAVRTCLRAAGELEAVAPAQLAPVIPLVQPDARRPTPRQPRRAA